MEAHPRFLIPAKCPALFRPSRLQGRPTPTALLGVPAECVRDQLQLQPASSPTPTSFPPTRVLLPCSQEQRAPLRYGFAVRQPLDEYGHLDALSPTPGHGV